MLHNVLETILFLGMISMNELCYSMLWIGYYSTTRHVIHLFINPLVYRCTNSADYNYLEHGSISKVVMFTSPGRSIILPFSKNLLRLALLWYLHANKRSPVDL